MTSIYAPMVPEGYEWCLPVNKDDHERIAAEFNGVPRRATWKPLRMKLVRKASREKFTYSDSPWYGSHALMFRRDAAEKMRPLLDQYGELLPVECVDADLFFFNATVVLDAFDDKASEGSRFSSGRFMMIRKYVFYPDVVKGVDIFKLANDRASLTFVSDRFVELWKSSGLVGLRFDKLWSSPD